MDYVIVADIYHNQTMFSVVYVDYVIVSKVYHDPDDGFRSPRGRRRVFRDLALLNDFINF